MSGRGKSGKGVDPRQKFYAMQLSALQGKPPAKGTAQAEKMDDFMLPSPIAQRAYGKAKQDKVQDNYNLLIGGLIAKRTVIMDWFEADKIGDLDDGSRIVAVHEKQQAIIRGDVPGLETTDSINQLLAMQNLEGLAEGKHKVIEIQGDGNCSARSLMFGTLISASVALKHEDENPLKAAAMKKTLAIMLADALALKALYEAGDSLVDVQGDPADDMYKNFPPACNTLIALIEGVLNNTLSTTELVFQANIDAGSYGSQSFPSRLNLALADLSHYMLYKEAMSDERDAIIIREHADTKRDLLKGHVAYSTIERSLVCQHLCIGSQTVLIRPSDSTVSFVNESIVVPETGGVHGELDHELPAVSFTTVTNEAQVGHTNLLLDASILEQMELERGLRADFSHIEAALRIEGIEEYVKQQTPDDILNDNRTVYVRRGIYGLHHPDFYSALYSENTKNPGSFVAFLTHLRAPTWKLQQKDILFEFEQELREKYMNLSPKNECEVRNKLVAEDLLNKIYSGELPEPLTDQDLTDQTYEFNIGGFRSHERKTVKFTLEHVNPQQQQVLAVLIAGINKTAIDQDWSPQFDNLRMYLQKIIKQLPKKQRPSLMSSIKVALTEYAQNEINEMPNHPTEDGELGYSEYQRELAGIDERFDRFIELIRLLNIPDPIDYKPLNRDRVEKVPTDVVAWEPPETLEDFVESIDASDSDKRNKWWARLSDQRTETVDQTKAIRAYFENKNLEMEALISGDTPDLVRVTALVKTLDGFIKKMINEKKPKVIPFGIIMMDEVAKTVKRSLDTQLNLNKANITKINKKEYTSKLGSLTQAFKDLGNLAATKKHKEFEASIVSFKEDLAALITNFPTNADTIRSTLTQIQETYIKKNKGHQLNADELQLKAAVTKPAKVNAAKNIKGAQPGAASYSFIMSLWNHDVWQDPDLVDFVRDPKTFYAGAFIFVVGAVALTVFTCGVGTFGLGMGLLLVAGLVTAIGALLAAPGTYRGAKAAANYTNNRFFHATNDAKPKSVADYPDEYSDNDDTRSESSSGSSRIWGNG